MSSSKVSAVKATSRSVRSKKPLYLKCLREVGDVILHKVAAPIASLCLRTTALFSNAAVSFGSFIYSSFSQATENDALRNQVIVLQKEIERMRIERVQHANSLYKTAIVMPNNARARESSSKKKLDGNIAKVWPGKRLANEGQRLLESISNLTNSPFLSKSMDATEKSQVNISLPAAPKLSLFLPTDCSDLATTNTAVNAMCSLPLRPQLPQTPTTAPTAAAVAAAATTSDTKSSRIKRRRVSFGPDDVCEVENISSFATGPGSPEKASSHKAGIDKDDTLNDKSDASTDTIKTESEAPVAKASQPGLLPFSVHDLLNARLQPKNARKMAPRSSSKPSKAVNNAISRAFSASDIKRVKLKPVLTQKVCPSVGPKDKENSHPNRSAGLQESLRFALSAKFAKAIPPTPLRSVPNTPGCEDEWV